MSHAHTPTLEHTTTPAAIARKLDADLRLVLSALAGLPRSDAEIALLLIRRGTLEALAASDIIEIDADDKLIGPVDAVRLTDHGAEVIEACAELAPAPTHTALAPEEFRRRMLGEADPDVGFAVTGGRRARG